MADEGELSGRPERPMRIVGSKQHQIQNPPSVCELSYLCPLLDGPFPEQEVSAGAEHRVQHP